MVWPDCDDHGAKASASTTDYDSTVIRQWEGIQAFKSNQIINRYIWMQAYCKDHADLLK